MDARLSRGRHAAILSLVTALAVSTPVQPPIDAAGPDDAPKAIRTVVVGSSGELAAAIAQARPGDHIVVKDGRYEGTFILRAAGTEDHPVVIRAATRGRAEIAGNATLELRGTEWVTVEGFRFTHRNTIKLTGCHHVRLTRNHFRMTDAPSEDGHHWTLIEGAASHDNRIDHNLFEEKHALGHFICIDGSRNPALASQRDRIDHNHFRDIGPFGEGMESIRIGFSQMALSSAFAIVEHNLFERCSGDLEIISIKSSDNVVRYNTFIESEGAIVARHGHRNSVIGNVVLGRGKHNTGGIRVYGNDNRIIGNYIEGLRDNRDELVAIKIDNGSVDHAPPYEAAELVRHLRVYRAVVAFNTLVDNQVGLQIGSVDYEAPQDGQDPALWIRRPLNAAMTPKDCVIANNVVVGPGQLVYQVTEPENLRWVGNLMFPGPAGILGTGAGVGSGGGVDSPGVLLIDPRLRREGLLWKLGPDSPAIDRAVDDYADVRDDLDGQPRTGARDVGADEFSSAPVLRRPLTPADVGPNGR